MAEPFDYRNETSRLRLVNNALMHPGEGPEAFPLWDDVPEEDRKEVARIWEGVQKEVRANPGATFMSLNE